MPRSRLPRCRCARHDDPRRRSSGSPLSSRLHHLHLRSSAFCGFNEEGPQRNAENADGSTQVNGVGCSSTSTIAFIRVHLCSSVAPSNQPQMNTDNTDEIGKLLC